MNGQAVRMESISIENFKNIQKGMLDFENRRKKYRASIVGLYGQNGSGKTALIDAIQLLKYSLCGKAIPRKYADCINVEKEFSILKYQFKIKKGEEIFHYKGDAIIIATGAAENMVTFEGWTLPGVIGAGAAQTMMNLHGVKPGNRILMLGSGNVGLVVSFQLKQCGCDVVALVEIVTAYMPQRLPEPEFPFTFPIPL